MWSYEDVFGNINALSGTTDASTRISTLSVTTDVPGYYSCEFSLDGGMNKIYTVEMMDVSKLTGMSSNAKRYIYVLLLDQLFEG